MFQLALLIAIFVGSDKPPLLQGFPAAPIQFSSALECEAARTDPKLLKAVAEMRADLVKKFKQNKVSVSTRCVQVASAPDEKDTF